MEQELLGIVRRDDLTNFTITITCRDDKWKLYVVDFDAQPLGPGSETWMGTGTTFAEAWQALNASRGRGPLTGPAR